MSVSYDSENLPLFAQTKKLLRRAPHVRNIVMKTLANFLERNDRTTQ